jgi:hypothetical protein
MGWSLERKRFLAALAVFLVWVAMLTALAVLSSRRPPTRTGPSSEPSSSSQPGPEAGK